MIALVIAVICNINTNNVLIIITTGAVSFFNILQRRQLV